METHLHLISIGRSIGNDFQPSSEVVETKTKRNKVIKISQGEEGNMVVKLPMKENMRTKHMMVTLFVKNNLIYNKRYCIYFKKRIIIVPFDCMFFS
jgi:hypothetical protein